jgi:hypothetical protein
MQPFDVFDAGRMAVLKDTQNAVFCLWEAKRHKGIGVENVEGALCWTELQTTDANGTRVSYEKLFGWKTFVSPEDPMQYIHLEASGEQFGGIWQIPAEMQGGVPPNWMPYFLVNSVDGKADQARQLGANLMVPPTDIPNTGRFSVIRDPQGAVFSIFQPA